MTATLSGSRCGGDRHLNKRQQTVHIVRRGPAQQVDGLVQLAAVRVRRALQVQGRPVRIIPSTN